MSGEERFFGPGDPAMPAGPGRVRVAVNWGTRTVVLQALDRPVDVFLNGLHRPLQPGAEPNEVRLGELEDQRAVKMAEFEARRTASSAEHLERLAGLPPEMGSKIGRCYRHRPECARPVWQVSREATIGWACSTHLVGMIMQVQGRRGGGAVSVIDFDDAKPAPASTPWPKL